MLREAKYQKQAVCKYMVIEIMRSYVSSKVSENQINLTSQTQPGG